MSRTEEILRLMRESGEIKWCPREKSQIADFYKEKNVFVTGATGFLGKLLVEKLLRACPDLGTIYILVRPKKGEDEHSRVDKLFSDPIFGPLSKLFPKFQHKISIIKGDISLPDLGLSPSSKTLIYEKINVIFHIAATVRFDEKITVATAINVRGTRDLLNMAKNCQKLQSFVHVSTAYANCVQKEINEVFYQMPISAQGLIELVETRPESTLIEQTKLIIGNWPNTYTFTKGVAEDAVKNFGKGLPVCVVRPAIVIATYKEPLRSWIDNLYGATGIVVGAGTGLLKTMHCDKTKTAELVPGDYVINNMIAASYKTAVEKITDKIPIYNYVSSVENHHTWEDFMQKCQLWGEEVPTIRCVWYYCLILNKFYFVHFLYSILLHFLPALIMDLGMVLSKQRPIMVKIYKKITKFESVISHFSTNEWKFHNDNTQALWNFINDDDRAMFPFSMKTLDWDEYHKTHALGLRQYLVKDDISTLPQAKIKWKRFYIANKVIKYLVFSVIFYVIYSIFLTLFNH
ncbi:fatty acyl-CoA reductase wat-like [Tribolium madens]|uniref:fatty acyl-CoA reductase wat-like n=1 Tax=Tribolium madens TaxID=41895 RepID=UPI001CF74280|nr:fatty acyl-CoA reductase wat-like [Tribolium madens]